ncbi:hypothetical protein OCK02_17100 [Rhizobium sp. TRM96647]|uniref:hypothetical protein n=1 Tax=unclassified Rhizobium TaxID=2613769 RepID=UPI0021E99898|nr:MULTISPECIES: hypothetical protein [unclassified Rhizobium]MCV3737922.1 hypothetical protein [Rhizobium sp. TRM96647]MCV3759348.1 hypothetical protein [Rhizobium sp. TRM96650]
MKRARKLLAADCDLETIAGSLRDAVEFVRSVFANMAGYSKDCQVRIALDSNPRCPDYLIEMLFHDEEGGHAIVHAQAIAVFSGKNHVGALADDANIRRTWSSSAMTYSNVQQLLGRLRGVLPA